MFALRPSRVELAPGGSVDMVLSGSSDSPKVRQKEPTRALNFISTLYMYPYRVLFSTEAVQERLVCKGFVGNQGCSKPIMTVDVTCRFVAPELRISSRQLTFYLEKVGQEVISPGYLYSKLHYYMRN